MQAWVFDRPAPAAERRIRLVHKASPRPGPDEVLLDVLACGICRTDLHLVEGDLPVRRSETVPGHQVVGAVNAVGDRVTALRPGDRVGVAWLRRTCGRCRWCRSGRENLCPDSAYTGWDADGGLAEQVVAPADFVYPLPAGASAAEQAPLLCAGIIGWRALRRARVGDGTRLGLYGFGSSAHICAQVALAQGAELFVMTRGEENRSLAADLGATWVGRAQDPPPMPLDAAIVFAPVGSLVPVALEGLARGGTLALAGIHMSQIPALDYTRHLFLEKDLRTVTSNTREDGHEMLAFAASHGVEVHWTPYPFEDVPRALADLSAGSASGSLVVVR
jgi:alcohol dehydrogenase, propanol-preferring